MTLSAPLIRRQTGGDTIPGVPARFFHCQMIIATHSPFLLAIRGAKIYDMEEETVDVKQWTELENVKVYYDFFKKNKDAFEGGYIS